MNAKPSAGDAGCAARQLLASWPAVAVGKLKVSLGPETEVLPAPHGKDVDVQIVVDLRRMPKQAGFAPDGFLGHRRPECARPWRWAVGRADLPA
jgi:hypothetical protein